MGRMSQEVVNLVIRRPLDEFAECLRLNGTDGCTVCVRKSEEGISDEGFCEGRRRPFDEEERVHTIRIFPGSGHPYNTDLDLDILITLAASAAGVLLRHSCLHLVAPVLCCIHHPCDPRTNHAPVS